MSASYEAARKIALGLEKERTESSGLDLWNISLGDGFNMQAEMPFQNFAKGFEPPDELLSHRAALMLYDDEFAADCHVAEGRLARLEKCLAARDEENLQALLEEAPLEEWLSLIFLDGDKLEKELTPLIEKAGDGCRSQLAAALDGAMERLVAFRELAEALRGMC